MVPKAAFLEKCDSPSEPESEVKIGYASFLVRQRIGLSVSDDLYRDREYVVEALSPAGNPQTVAGYRLVIFEGEGSARQEVKNVLVGRQESGSGALEAVDIDPLDVRLAADMVEFITNL